MLAAAEMILMLAGVDEGETKKTARLLWRAMALVADKQRGLWRPKHAPEYLEEKAWKIA